jgi:histidine kinase
VDADGGLVESDELRIHPALSSRLNGVGLAAAPFKTDRVSGWVFFADIRTATPEIIPLAEVVAREIGASLDQLHVTRQLQEIAASEERIRVARDLHDGVLQSLTGIRLGLRSMAVSLDGESTSWDRLFAIERALAIEQRELRFFIGGLSPTPVGDGEAPRAEASLSSRLELLRERIAAEWKVPVTIRVAHDLASLPLRITEAIPPMVHEAVVNALKQSQPSRVIAAAQPEPGGLRIIVSDDGHRLNGIEKPILLHILEPTQQLVSSLPVANPITDESADLLTTDQVMDRLLAEPSLRRKAVSCVLGAVKCGSEWRFRRSDLETWIARQFSPDVQNVPPPQAL